MKKFLLILLVVLPFNLIAHPPSEINIEYDLQKYEVYIEINHKVRSKEDHYIYEIVVSLNGKKIIKQEAKTQFDNEKQKFVYLIPELKENDKISVFAECNKGGSKKKEIIIKKAEKISE